jgi:molybdopterin-guanine dinucleotide biosynthesis protein MobB
MFDDLPILAVCGWSGSGKTTLIEGIVPRLCAQGLSVAVVKHDVHGIDLDRPGKDSDRLFRAGADVLLQGPGEELFRVHNVAGDGLTHVLLSLSRRYDLVLVEGHKDTPLPKVWLLAAEESAPPLDRGEPMAVLPWNENRVDVFLSILNEWLPRQWLRTPALGCVLIGGQHMRMGRPRNLLRTEARTRLERTVGLLQQATESVVIAGTGRVPETLRDHVRLPDVADAAGPMAGVLAAMRWAPEMSWLVVECDLPDVTLEALQWLLSTRRPGIWATVPRPPGSPSVEPLLAHYDFRSRLLLDKLTAERNFRLRDIASSAKVISPCPPRHLSLAWKNTDAALEPRSPLREAHPPMRGEA